MALITRVSRLFQADFHAVLDRIEEPDVLLRQAIREMEDALQGGRQRQRLLSHEQEQLETHSRDLEQQIDGIEEELDVCFASDKADLARTLIRRKLESQRLHKQLSMRRDSLRKTRSELEKQLAQNQSQLESMRQKAELLAEDQRSDTPDTPWRGPEITVCDEDVEIAFLREQQKRRRS